MNNLQSNERHLADKLRNVPVPDVDRSWEQMRRLLDRDMPEGGAAGWGGNRKWWWMGITAGIIMLSVWLTQQLNNSGNEGLANTEAVNNTPPSPAANSDNNNATGNTTSQSNNDKNATQAIVDKDNNKNTTDNNVAGDNTANNNATPANTPGDKPSRGQQLNAADDNENAVKTNDQRARTTDKSITPSYGKKRTANSINSPVRTKDDDRTTGNSVTSKRATADENILSDKELQDNTRRNNGRTVDAKKNNSSIDDIASEKTADQNLANASGKDKGNEQLDRNAGSTKTPDTRSFDNASGTAETVVRDVEASAINTSLVEEDQITGPSTVFNDAAAVSPRMMAIHGKTDRESARQLRDQYMEKDNRPVSGAQMRGNFGGEDREITFAAGLTIPQSFAIGNQQASSYNVSAKTSRIADYLPAPFFQYYINPKLFLQTEFHFQSPQYTDRLLLSRSSMQPSPTMTLEKNVYLEKLYYFNIPFNVYYSPARNFFIGSGLQYSSLLSGVASFEEKRTDGSNPASYQSFTRRFKDDSVAAMFAPSEWRYQFDANYYFKRFTLGVRYNQAMRDFVNLRVNSALPVTQDRNRSFLLYLRFNILEQRKKGGYYSAYNW
ncbi:MAG TPA: hypothetical protein VD993_16330 [Chitinophagaceae bacterium]|nr:hypothetical protein [Chitinophagaceae bacterium]